MKKIVLTVAAPCQENWNAMTPEQKGRFCSSCQKTVVDFSQMSDSQMAAYFKKPVGSTCGRFYNDQLNREITPRRKRMPWVKYFFHLLWPGFLLFLKSCGQKETTTGLLEVKDERSEDVPMIMGVAISEITPVDTASIERNLPIIDRCSITIGALEVKLSADTLVKAAQEKEAPLEKVEAEKGETNLLAKTTIDSFESQNLFREDELITMGAVAVIIKDNKANSPLVNPGLPVQEKKKAAPEVYPNPVSNGQMITISHQENLSGVYQVLSASGQVYRTGKLFVSKGQRFLIPVQAWPAGTSFIRLIDEPSKSSYTKKVVVQ